MYDFANSAYSTSIVTVLFAVYFVKAVVPPQGGRFLGIMWEGESLWGFLVTAVMAVVIIFSPFMGAWADRNASKRKFLFWLTLAGGLGTTGLFLARPGYLGTALGFGFLSFLAYELAQVFYNAFLNDIAEGGNSGRISGLGFALGYIGGGLCLALNLWMIKNPQFFGLGGPDSSLPLRASFFVVGIWWLLFSLPTFIWVKDKTIPRERVPLPVMGKETWDELRDTFRMVLKEKDISRFLLAYLIFNDGIQTLLVMSSIVGARLTGMSTADLALCFLVIQFVAFFGASFFGWLADKWSHKKAILLTLAVYIFVSLWASIMRRPGEFWVLGIITGIILGGSQSAARSLYSKMIPADRASEFFSFLAVVGKASALFGPLIFGLVVQKWGLRPGVASFALFYLVGGLILCSVKERNYW